VTGVVHDGDDLSLHVDLLLLSVVVVSRFIEMTRWGWR
jgi:hypothetical protein